METNARNEVRAVITTHSMRYTIDQPTGPVVRVVQIAIVRREVNRPSGWHLTRARIVDAGDATASAAWNTALRFARGGEIVRREVDHGSIGTFGPDDAGRDDMLSAIGRVVRAPQHVQVLDYCTSGSLDEVTY